MKTFRRSAQTNYQSNLHKIQIYIYIYIYTYIHKIYELDNVRHILFEDFTAQNRNVAYCWDGRHLSVLSSLLV